MSTELSGHNQEVNCLDAKDGLIVSGSRDRTTRVRTPLLLQFINIMHSVRVFTVGIGLCPSVLHSCSDQPS